MKPGNRKDCNNGRDRWYNRGAFIVSATGASIGVGNIWKFGALTYKHGG
jgi:NSS family neurotransmitter:Na+ symporter